MKKLLPLILLIILTVQAEAQKRTNVKGYYRKDGTYVRPHTRTTSGSATTKTSNYSSSNTKSIESTNSIISSTLVPTPITKTEFAEKISNHSYSNNREITETQLIGVSFDLNSEKPNSEGVIIYVSVLRYNGTTIDICPITRGIVGDWEFTKVQHRFNKVKISSDEALELISNYGWEAKKDEISKNYSYSSYNDKGLPKYLTKTIEAIKLK